MEQAFLHDFNVVIEDFDFYNTITPKMQTELIRSTKNFREFENSFAHFFEQCERGFINEFIINMYCRIHPQNKTIISYGQKVTEIFFITQGLVEVFNIENDEALKEKPILYMPKYSYFGDYQTILNVKSNLVYKTKLPKYIYSDDQMQNA